MSNPKQEPVNSDQKSGDKLKDYGEGVKESINSLSQYVSKHGPRLWLGGLLAYRRGSKALATNALSASGVDFKSAVLV